ncbi:hypothetical protein MBCUT_06520 [Methanobrevibacter cuticularis]|uniref:Uncharacterized protein n=1 Tax=Methanobrevibacter cuticularis TaxID=47311 RepID=A0A166EG43_9EURY|nr:hypothetical protein [Methanobrevibacter cuticularis]KZX16614.1 hypothetical protein MBCUT_06520 [Methanobrevibacter cuticularis]
MMNDLNRFLDSVSKENIVESTYNRMIEFSKLESKEAELRFKITKKENWVDSRKNYLLNNTDFESLGITNIPAKKAKVEELVDDDKNYLEKLKRDLKKHELEMFKQRRLLRLTEMILSKMGDLDE